MDWDYAEPAEEGLDPGQLARARDYALSGQGSGMVVRNGGVVMSWGDLLRRYDLKSTSKSIGVTALGLAIGDGKMRLEDPAVTYHPAFAGEPASNRATGWIEHITIDHLATQTAGFAKPGGYEPLLFEPGSAWHYSDGGPNWLAECITLAYRQDVQDLLFDRVFTPLGITRTDLRWRENAYRPHHIDGITRREFGSGIHANVQAMARIGQLYLAQGRWHGTQLIPADFAELAAQTTARTRGLPEHDPEKHGDASEHYGLLWWNNADGTLRNVPRDAFWSWGLHESLILVIPSLDLVAARAGRSWQRQWGGHYTVLEPFFGPLAASVKTAVPRPHAPCPPSDLIVGVAWAPRPTIIRLADGSDNWPLTWGDDGALYTAYGDGWGFAPRVPAKLSLGFAKVEGDPPDIRGINIRSATGEQTGQGRHGRKASGMLMVKGVLYMLARNAGNAQIAWSEDHGVTWTWCPWRFETSFGCPAFVNVGRNGAGMRDDCVYVVSFDSDTAYDPADATVLARAPVSRLRERAAYEFFAGMTPAGTPTWSPRVRDRAAILRNPGRCYRTTMSFSAPLKRYLMCQIVPGKDTRFEGGFGIYEAPEPWGPWHTVFYTDRWDVGPGETCSLPPKWMSSDGTIVHLVFSGDDHFSVRRAALVLRP